MYKAGKQRSEEAELIEAIRAYTPREPLRGPLALSVKCYFEPPKRKSRRWREQALSGLRRPAKKPDLSNCIKNIEDVANGRLWFDDSQIVELLPGTGKYYGSPARWEIEVIPLTGILDD